MTSPIDQNRRAAARRKPAAKPAGGQGQFKVDQSRLQATAAINAAKAKKAAAGKGNEPVTNKDVADISAQARGGTRDAVKGAIEGADPSKAADAGAMGAAIAARKNKGQTTTPAGGDAGTTPAGGTADKPTTPLEFGGTIQPGQKDGAGKNDVATAQNALSTLKGPDGQPYLKPGSYKPGENDAATQAATKKFQEDQAAAGVQADGKIGKQTTAALNAALEAQGHDPSAMKTDAGKLEKQDKVAQADAAAGTAAGEADKTKAAAEKAEADAKAAEETAHGDGAAVKALEAQKAKQEAENKPLEAKDKRLTDAQAKAKETAEAERKAKEEMDKVPDSPWYKPDSAARNAAEAKYAQAQSANARAQRELKMAERAFPQQERTQLEAGRKSLADTQRGLDAAKTRSDASATTAINARANAGQATNANNDAQAKAAKAKADADAARTTEARPVETRDAGTPVNPTVITV